MSCQGEQAFLQNRQGFYGYDIQEETILGELTRNGTVQATYEEI